MNGKIVSTMHVYLRTVYIRGEPVAIGGLGDVRFFAALLAD